MTREGCAGCPLQNDAHQRELVPSRPTRCEVLLGKPHNSSGLHQGKRGAGVWEGV